MTECSPQVSYENYQRTGYFAALDGLRGLSILAVLWHHSTPRPFEGVLGRGHLGVRLFFAISGFLITSLLLRELARGGRVALGAFWLRRAVRLLPLYYVVLFGFLVRAALLPPGNLPRDHFLLSFPYFFTHTANWFVDFGVAHPIWFAFGWSLSTEQQFYVLWPPLLCLAYKLGRGALASCLVLGAMIIIDQLAERGLLSAWLPDGSTGFDIVTSFIASIAFGALWAVLLETPRTFATVGRLLGQAPCAWGLGLWVALWVVWPPADFVWFECLLGALVAACAVGKGSLPRLLEHAWLRHVGRVSYGMYLLHVPIIGLLKGLIPDPAANMALLFCATLLLTLGAATLTERYFETPLRNWARRFQWLRHGGTAPA